MSEEITTLGEALPREIARVRDELLPQYIAIGPAGMFGAAMLRLALNKATKALAEGDVIAMLAAYEELKACK